MRRQRRMVETMGVLRTTASGLLTVLGGVGTLILIVLVLVLLPLALAGVLVDQMMFRPERERELRATLQGTEAQLGK